MVSHSQPHTSTTLNNKTRDEVSSFYRNPTPLIPQPFDPFQNQVVDESEFEKSEDSENESLADLLNIIPSSQRKMSLNFSTLKTSSNNNDENLEICCGTSSLPRCNTILSNSNKTPESKKIVKFLVNNTQPLNLSTKMENKKFFKMQHQPLLQIKTGLNRTKPLNLISELPCDGLFSDLENESPNKLTLNYSGDKITANSSHKSQISNNAWENSAKSSTFCSTQKKISKDEANAMSNLFSPFPNSEYTSCSKGLIFSEDKILYPKLDSVNSEKFLSLSNTVQTRNEKGKTRNVNCCNCPLYPKVESISNSIRAILKDKLNELEGSNVDNLRCLFRMKDYEGDSCKRKDEYYFDIENEGIPDKTSKCRSPKSEFPVIKTISQSSQILDVEEPNKNKSVLNSSFLDGIDEIVPQSQIINDSISHIFYKKKKRKKSNLADNLPDLLGDLLTDIGHINKKGKHKKCKSYDTQQLNSQTLSCVKRNKKSHVIKTCSFVSTKNTKGTYYDETKDCKDNYDLDDAPAEIISKKRRNQVNDDTDHKSKKNPSDDILVPQSQMESNYSDVCKKKKKSKHTVNDLSDTSCGHLPKDDEYISKKTKRKKSKSYDTQQSNGKILSCSRKEKKIFHKYISDVDSCGKSIFTNPMM